MYSGNVKTFDSAGSWSFDNLTDRNVINFGADNSHHLTLTIVRVTLMCNRKVQLSQLMENLVCQRKKFIINFSKTNTKVCLTLHYNADNSYLFPNGR